MNDQLRYVAVAFYALVSTAAIAAPPSSSSIGLSTRAVRLTYDSASEVSESITATVTLPANSQTLDYYITFSPGPDSRLASSNLGYGQVPYYLYDSAIEPRSELQDKMSAIAESDVLSGTLVVTSKKDPKGTQTFALVLKPGSFVASGTYEGTITAQLWNGTFPFGTSVASTNLGVSVTVKEILNVATVPVGDDFTYGSTELALDFGVLQEGSVQSLDLVALANTRQYTLSIQSTNAGVLTYADTSYSSSETIPYQLYVDGVSLDLSSGGVVRIIRGAGPTTVAGARYRLDFKILPFEIPTAGVYKDTLIVTLSRN